MAELAYKVDGKAVSLRVDGAVRWGEDIILAELEDNLFEEGSDNGRGYTIQNFLHSRENAQLRDGLLAWISEWIPDLAGYGNQVSNTEHFQLMKDLCGPHDMESFPLSPHLVEERVSEILQVPVTLTHPTLAVRGFCLRFVRPGSCDYNPPHRDVWLPRLKNAVNLYFPLFASTTLSSLPLVPGSHLWRESELCRTLEGAVVGGRSYTVPTVVALKRPYVMTRPNPSADQVLLFSPYLIHGGGCNFGNLTRVSLEMRFWRRGNCL